jgi:hypothetical protein
MATKITRQVLEAYLNCKIKAHLKLADQQGNMSDYEALLVSTRQAVRRQAIAKILARTPEVEVARDISPTAATLRAGLSTESSCRTSTLHTTPAIVHNRNASSI